MKSKNEIAQLGLVLFSITAVVALLLSMVNAITKDKIEQINLKIVQEAMAEVMPGAQLEAPVYDTGSDEVVAYAKADNGGCCFQVEENGFGGTVTMIVGVDADGAVTGVKVTKHSETPGLGAKSQDATWIAQFKGTTSGVTVTKGDAADNQVEAISGATITSNAVATGVNAACQYAQSME